jgi:hypothetical protein
LKLNEILTYHPGYRGENPRSASFVPAGGWGNGWTLFPQGTTTRNYTATSTLLNVKGVTWLYVPPIHQPTDIITELRFPYTTEGSKIAFRCDITGSKKLDFRNNSDPITVYWYDSYFLSIFIQTSSGM